MIYVRVCAPRRQMLQGTLKQRVSSFPNTKKKTTPRTITASRRKEKKGTNFKWEELRNDEKKSRLNYSNNKRKQNMKNALTGNNNNTHTLPYNCHTMT